MRADEKFSRRRSTTARARDLRTEVSRTERRLWPYLRDSKLGAPFRRQHPVGKYFADYCCLPLKLVVEVDGDGHDSVRDALRDLAMKLGFGVMRFGVRDLDRDMRQAVDAIHAEVQMRLMARSVGSDPHLGGEG